MKPSFGISTATPAAVEQLLYALQKAEEADALKKQEEQAKEEQAKIAAESKKQISTEVVVLLVETRIDFDAEFDGKKAKNSTLCAVDCHCHIWHTAPTGKL